MRIVSYIFLITIILLGVSFAMLNSNVVAINYFIGHRTMPLSLLLVSAFTVGCVLGLLVASVLVIKAKMRNHQLRKQLKISEKEIENLRAIPLKDAQLVVTE